MSHRDDLSAWTGRVDAIDGEAGRRPHHVVARAAPAGRPRLASPALYFGTTTGQLWMGREGGEHWECVFDALPPINNVKVAVV